MPVKPTDRPLKSLRESTINLLIANYGHGHLSLEAFERRLDEALDAKDHQTLLTLTEDLEQSLDQDSIEEKKEALGIDYENPDIKQRETIFHLFGGGNRNGEWPVAREVLMINICGGGELDFSHARFSAKTTTLKIYCIMGGAGIYVPEGINVQSRVFSICGGFGNRVRRPADPDAPTLIIEGFMFMGGAGVRVRKTFREKLIELGESMRSTFGGKAASRKDFSSKTEK